MRLTRELYKEGNLSKNSQDLRKGTLAMKLLKQLISKPQLMQRILGLQPSQFQALKAAIEPLWIAYELKKKISKIRKRQIGAGRRYHLLTLAEKLLAVLLYYKTYMTQELIGQLTNLDQGNVSRLIAKMSELIEKAADPELSSYLQRAKDEYKRIPKQERIRTWSGFIRSYPDLEEVATDATEQPCYRSKNYEQQEKFYSGKKKRHTIKTQITVSSQGRILDVSNMYAGSIHDKKVIDQENTIEKLPEQTCQRFDAGYVGVTKEHPQSYLLVPYKKPPKKELTPLEKELNTVHSRHRIIAENVFSRMKKFKICQQTYRGPLEKHNKMFRNVAALINFKLLRHRRF